MNKDSGTTAGYTMTKLRSTIPYLVKGTQGYRGTWQKGAGVLQGYQKCNPYPTPRVPLLFPSKKHVCRTAGICRRGETKCQQSVQNSYDHKWPAHQSTKIIEIHGTVLLIQDADSSFIFPLCADFHVALCFLDNFHEIFI